LWKYLPNRYDYGIIFFVVFSNGILDNSKAPEISNDLDDLNSKAWMKTDTASIQRDSLDR
jgi:hypothetical protein